MLFYFLLVKKCFPTFGRVAVTVLRLGNGVEYVEENRSTVRLKRVLFHNERSFEDLVFASLENALRDLTFGLLLQ